MKTKLSRLLVTWENGVLLGYLDEELTDCVLTEHEKQEKEKAEKEKIEREEQSEAYEAKKNKRLMKSKRKKGR